MPPENRSTRLYWLILVLALAFPCGRIGYLVYLRQTAPLNGWWIEESTMSKFPDQMSLKVKNGAFQIRYPNSGGVTKIALQLDGRPHEIKSTSNPVLGDFANATYRAKLIGRSVEIAFEGEQIDGALLGEVVSFPPKSRWTQQWTLSEDGHLTVLGSPGNRVEVFRRAPLGRWLFQSAP